MLKPEELRIGNIVLSKEGDYIRILAMFDKSVRNEIYTISNEKFKYEEDDTDGIPLTPEILEKCGFIDRSGTIANRMSFGLTLFDSQEFCWYIQDGFMRYQSKGMGFTTSLTHIKFLHQLQNLYFALTGNELIVNI